MNSADYLEESKDEMCYCENCGLELVAIFKHQHACAQQTSDEFVEEC